MTMMMKKGLVLGLVFVSLAACRTRSRDHSDDPAPAAPPATAVVAAAPVAPIVTAALPAAPATPAAAPAAAPAAPVVKAASAPVVAAPVVAAPAPVAVNTVAECRRTFDRECTITCDRRVNERTFPGSAKRRIEHDLCFAECTRAAINHCH